MFIILVIISHRALIFDIMNEWVYESSITLYAYLQVFVTFDTFALVCKYNVLIPRTTTPLLNNSVTQETQNRMRSHFSVTPRRFMKIR